MLEVRTEAWVGVVSRGASLLGVHTAVSPASSAGHPVSMCVRISSFCKDTGQIVLGSMFLASFHLITSSETPLSKSRVWRFWGLGINLWIWGDISQCQSITSPNKSKNRCSSLEGKPQICILIESQHGQSLISMKSHLPGLEELNHIIMSTWYFLFITNLTVLA